MISEEDLSKITDAIVAKDIVSVEFIRDYLRIHFEDVSINYYVWPIVKWEQTHVPMSEGYRDALCALVDKIVIGVESKAEEFSLIFSDGSLVCPLDDASRVIPEAFEIGGKGIWAVFQ